MSKEKVYVLSPPKGVPIDTEKTQETATAALLEIIRQQERKIAGTYAGIATITINSGGSKVEETFRIKNNKVEPIETDQSLSDGLQCNVELRQADDVAELIKDTLFVGYIGDSLDYRLVEKINPQGGFDGHMKNSDSGIRIFMYQKVKISGQIIETLVCFAGARISPVIEELTLFS